jgi:hypothetical protein
MAKSLIGEIRKSIQQLNPNEVVDASRRPVRVLLKASSEPMYAFLERFLVPAGPNDAAASMLSREGSAEAVDIVIVEAGMPAPKGAFVFDKAHPEQLIDEILNQRDDLNLALARTFPAFRPAVSERLRHMVSKENAMFAVGTALPNIMPGLAWLPWAVPEAVSDTAVLTVNQVRMAFLLAAANGKPIGYREQKAEIAAIIAGAFGWRTLARELVGKIPFGAGLVPKAAIAYAATWVEGRSLERLYAHGIGFSGKERKAARDEAMGRGKAAASAFLEAYRASHDKSRFHAKPHA